MQLEKNTSGVEQENVGGLKDLQFAVVDEKTGETYSLFKYLGDAQLYAEGVSTNGDVAKVVQLLDSAGYTRY